MKKIFNIISAFALIGGVSSANAALFDRGNGLIYDNVLDITWLQTPTLAATNTFGVSGINNGTTDLDENGHPYAAGTMTWNKGFEWIAAMNAANYKGFSNWRMPKAGPVNGVSLNYTISYDGSTDRGFNNEHTTNELSHLFYATLGNIGQCSTANATGSDPDTCIKNEYGKWGLQKTGPFVDFTVGRYFTSAHDTRPDEERAFDLESDGRIGTGATQGPKFVWAVISGDVARLTAVPVPAAAWLLGSGIFGLAAVARRKKTIV